VGPGLSRTRGRCCRDCWPTGWDGRRGRRVEYSVDWPVDARARAAIDAVREQDRAAGLTAGGKADEHAQVVELTGLLRHSVAGNQLAGRPPDLRVFAHRTPSSSVSRPNSARTRTGGTGRPPPTPPLGRSSSSTPATQALRPCGGQNEGDQGLLHRTLTQQGLRPHQRLAPTGDRVCCTDS
jgi:hypothetical protein